MSLFSRRYPTAMTQSFYWPIHAVPPFRRTMIFVDGENLVHRFQHMVTKGWVPHTGDLAHIPDSVIWHSGFSIDGTTHEILRATYYTYVVGDPGRVEEVEAQIRGLSFNRHRNSTLPNQLTPRVFKKEKKSAKSKGVDIAMVVDILGHVYAGNLDTVLLLSGDGDYLPLITDVQRAGKQCYVGAFSDGLNAKLPLVADAFFCLNNTAFASAPASPEAPDQQNTKD
jgi:uncharacterized LabA/DUF88 family protein